VFSLPVGYFHADDRSLIGKRNLEPGQEIIPTRRVKEASVGRSVFPVEGELWAIVLNGPMDAGGCGNDIGRPS
jgi:hypothetical protein